ncbi:uncharacterized protein LOC119339418 [Triticum dicoccoides]|uniref:uncharacterized protein LOC119339418 n=1 Tax=Triticum dicoccoides TaxID=85692 RepID=UPI001890FA3E|nr:uncharacterized protein LOC119339418 [Triticum dicoccoides]
MPFERIPHVPALPAHAPAAHVRDLRTRSSASTWSAPAVPTCPLRLARAHTRARRGEPVAAACSATLRMPPARAPTRPTRPIRRIPELGLSSAEPRRAAPPQPLRHRAGPSWYDSSTTHESVGTAAAPPRAAADVDPAVLVQAWLMLIGLILLAVAVWHYTRPRRTVVKLQVALLGLAKPFQKELNEIAEKVEASNQRWYKFILTETICALNRHNDCCVSSSLSADVKVGADSWEGHFDKISLEERSKFDEETLYNLDGIKRKKEYSKKPDGFSNEYIVVTILVAADGALKFAEIKTPADLVAVLEKLNSIPTREIRGVNVLWTPQEENDILSEERLLADYPNLKPLSDY